MSRRLAVIAVLFAISALAFAADKSLEQLKAEVAAAKPQDQPKLYTQIADLELKEAEGLFGSGDMQKAQAAIADLTGSCENAAKAAVNTRKHVKNTEISLRKISERLDALSRSVDFDNRPPVKAAMDRIEQARTSLLDAMFKK